ncbi:MAG: CDP-alcohol phosphatidyltransferase family protein [Vampirovibrionales bacterium]|nr:CDP-alcohol phosphatidyltransferase family protein [Vampirovibrionales bacterium]
MANWISIIRTLLALGTVALLFRQAQAIYWLGFVLTVIVIWMDGLDGYVARKFNESSKTGAVIDILCDRIVEQIYWVAYLALGWVPLWVPLVVIMRGISVDGLRGLALERGFTAFGDTTMMQSKIGWWLVSSPLSRWSYAFFKAAAFAFLILAHMPNASSVFSPDILALLTYVANASVYIAVFFCVVRGLPVLIEGRRFL